MPPCQEKIKDIWEHTVLELKVAGRALINIVTLREGEMAAVVPQG